MKDCPPDLNPDAIFDGNDPIDPNRADPNRADPNRADPNRADPNRADPNRASLTRTKLGRIKAISFDLDDTLWDCEPVILRAEQSVYRWIERHAPRVTAVFTPADVQAHRVDYAKRHPQYRCDVSYLRRESIRALLSDFSYPRDVATALAEQAFDHFYIVRSQVELYHDAIWVLENTKKYYKIAALTNGNADLAQIGIAHFFDDIQRASLTNAPKPHRAMFDNAAVTLGVMPSEILHIGDNPSTDVDGGRAAGTMTVWFNQHGESWPNDLPEADFEITALSALLELLPACRSNRAMG